MADEFDWVERDRGVLTQRDRELLLGRAEDELDQNAWNVRRYNIRERVENAIHDFQILAQSLAITDIQQLFEPAYEWSRERRRREEDGPASGNPELTRLLRSWMALFEFFSYGIYVGGKQETQILMQGLVENGIERGFREWQNENLPRYREVDAELQLNYSNLVRRDNYLRGIESGLPSNPSEIAEEVVRLRRNRKISEREANELFKKYVRNPTSDR